MVIKIHGIVCPRCRKLEENTRKAIKEMGLTATIEKVTELSVIIKYNVKMTPGFIVDEKVKASGKVLSVEQIKKIITS